MAAYKPLLWALAFVLVVVISPGSMPLLFIGMLPTLVAFLVDSTPGRYAAMCVGGMNFCGVFPWVWQLWTGDNSISAAVETMTDPFALLVMYGAAAFGWILFMIVPPVIGAVMAVVSQHRIAQLRADQRELIAEWGPEIATAERDDDLED
jgi:hypothetical protein